MLEGKVAIITGGTRGIGFATTKKFLQEGASVALLGHGETTVSKALNTLVEENPDYDVIGLCPDLSNPKMVKEAFQEIKKKFGHIDILINNAGIYIEKTLAECDEKDFGDVMSTNFESIFNTSNAILEYMTDGGVIINTSSSAAIYGKENSAIYSASKSAINGFTKSLSRELSKNNIRVNAIAPGLIHTDIIDTLSQDTIEEILKKAPMGRFGEPEEVANVIAFLASDKASYINGSIITVDGGYIC